jgi:hypothetical protein
MPLAAAASVKKLRWSQQLSAEGPPPAVAPRNTTAPSGSQRVCRAVVVMCTGWPVVWSVESMWVSVLSMGAMPRASIAHIAYTVSASRGTGGYVESVSGRVSGERVGHLDPAVRVEDRVEFMQRGQCFPASSPGPCGRGGQVRGRWWVPGCGEVAHDQLVHRPLSADTIASAAGETG